MACVRTCVRVHAGAGLPVVRSDAPHGPILAARPVVRAILTGARVARGGARAERDRASLNDGGFHGKAKAPRRGAPGSGPARGRAGAAPTRPQQRAARPVRASGAAGGTGGIGARAAIATTVQGLGYELVDVERAQRGLLRVTIDRIPGRAYEQPGDAVTVDDCEQVTRQLQYVLEVEGLDYARLEVSSPGLDRPLRSESDYRRFAGQPAKVTLKVPFEGRKVWQGVLGAGDVEGGWQLVFTEGKTEQVFGFRFDEVREARLVPVVDFKGRNKPGGNAGPAPVDGTPASAAAAEEQAQTKGE